MPGRSRTSLTTYYTRGGARRRIRLYEAWWNLKGRLQGGKSRQGRYWRGRDNEFLDWLHFRSWALANGYRRGVELDRIDSSGPYAPFNCQWLTKAEHFAKTAPGARGAVRRMQAVNLDGEYVPF